MTRCIASCRNGKRCRKNAVANKLCWVHCEVECLLCKGGCPVKVRKTLRNCGHSFCKNCIARDFYDFQWFDGAHSTHEALKKVGAIIERPNFYPYMSAEDNLKLVCKIKNIPFTKVSEKLELVGLLERKDSKF